MSNIIAMAFSPRNIVGCLLKKGLQRGGHGHPRDPPRYALGHYIYVKIAGAYISEATVHNQHENNQHIVVQTGSKIA